MGPRTVLVVALAAWAGWLLARGAMRRRVPWAGVAIIAVPLVLFFWTERQWVTAEQRFSAVARSMAPAAAGVHCQRLGETFTANAWELGHVDFDDSGVPTGPAVLSYETCQRLTAYWRSSPSERSAPPLEQVVAVHVLSHESMHLTGIASESLAECDALQRDAGTAEQLGATPEQGRLLAETYLTRVYPRMPADYTSRDCARGGRLDLTPDDSSWP